MIVTPLPLAPELWATLPAPDPGALLDELATLRRENAALRVENAALRVENAALHQQIQELSARLGQNAANSFRPPFSDSLQAAVRPPAPPSGRKRGGQPGHRGAFRAQPPVEAEGGFGSDSDAGSRFAERLLTVVASCRQQGRRLLAFLVAAVGAGLRGSSPPSLLPAGQRD